MDGASENIDLNIKLVYLFSTAVVIVIAQLIYSYSISSVLTSSSEQSHVVTSCDTLSDRQKWPMRFFI